MSAILHGASPAHAAPLPNAARGDGFFSHHGVWAPGVRLFRRLAFASKAAIISLAFMLPMLGLLGWTLQKQAEQALQARHEALHQHVQMAHGLLAWAHSQETQGRLPRAQAQQLVLQALQPMQHEGGERFWVQDQQLTLLLPGSPGAAPQKLSHALRFDPWNWTIGTSMSVADLGRAQWHGLAWIGGVATLAMLASGYLFLSFYRVMEGGLRETRRHLRAMSDGDLTTTPWPWGKDESAQLMRELSRMQASLRSMVHNVRRSSDGIAQASVDVAGGAAELSERTQHAAAALEQSTRSMKQSAAKVNSSVTHIAEASRVARHNAGSADAALMPCIVSTISRITRPPSSAMPALCRATREASSMCVTLLFTLAAICFIDRVDCSSAAAACRVRSDRSAAPPATSSLACAMPSLERRTLCTMLRSDACMRLSSSISWALSSLPQARGAVVRSPSLMARRWRRDSRSPPSITR